MNAIPYFMTENKQNKEMKKTLLKTYVDRRDYLRFKNTRKSVHRHIAEKQIGRKLKSWEEVHHINGNKLYNDPTNLEVLDHDEHFEIHLRQKWRAGVW